MYVINLKIAKAIKENEEKDYEAFKTKIEKLTDEKREIYKGNQEIINKVLNVYLEEIKNSWRKYGNNGPQIRFN